MAAFPWSIILSFLKMKSEGLDSILYLIGFMEY